MDNLINFNENESNTIYIIDNMQGLVSVPKDLSDNIKIFITFKDIQNNLEQEKNNLINEITNISNNINNEKNDGIFIIIFAEENILKNQNAFTFSAEFVKIKNIVNIIYNNLLKTKKFKKENFVRQIDLLYDNDKYKNFMNWLCLQSPSKFSASSYQQVINEDKQEDIFLLNNTSFSIFNNEDKEKLHNLAHVTSDTPITETLTIGNVQNNINQNNESSGGGPSNIKSENLVPNAQNVAKAKTLVKSLYTNHKSAAFINWNTALFIIAISLFVGIAIATFISK